MQAFLRLTVASEDDRRVDLTSMLDVVFIMLIFFVVTAAFIKESGIDANPPDVADITPPNDNNLLIEIADDSTIWIGTRLIDMRAIRANIAGFRAESPGGSVVIRPHKQSKSKVLVGVMDASRQAGVYDYALASE